MKQNFLEEDDIIEQWNLWKSSSDDIESRVVSEELARQMMTIAEHLLCHERFKRYPTYAKEEMAQDGVVKCMKNLKNYDPSKGKLFSYFT